MNKYTILLLSTCGLVGCAPVAVFSTATSVGTAAVEERGVGGVISDSSISTQINALWFAHDPNISKNVGLQVREGKVLLSGHVDNVQQQIDAVRLAWKVKGVREVIDDTAVGEGNGFTGYLSDSWISAKIKSKLLVNEKVESINYNFKTVGGTVYLMGIAKNPQELATVEKICKDTDGVKKVVNYVRIKDNSSQVGDDSWDDGAIEVEPIQAS